MPDAASTPLPHNLEAERSVLGDSHSQRGRSPRPRVVNPRDFFRDAHRRIFAQMAELSEAAPRHRFVTLKEALARAGEARRGRWPAYIAALVDGPHDNMSTTRASFAKTTLRNLIFSANKILARQPGGAEANQILTRPRHLRHRRGSRAERLRVDAHPGAASFETIERAHERKQLITGVPSGSPIDEHRGLPARRLITHRGPPFGGQDRPRAELAQHVGRRRHAP